jgi:hypothetical protein
MHMLLSGRVRTEAVIMKSVVISEAEIHTDYPTKKVILSLLHCKSNSFKLHKSRHPTT